MPDHTFTIIDDDKQAFETYTVAADQLYIVDYSSSYFTTDNGYSGLNKLVDFNQLIATRHGNKEVYLQRVALNKRFNAPFSILYRHAYQKHVSDMNHEVNVDSAVYPIAVRAIANNSHFIERYPFQVDAEFFDCNRKPVLTKEHNIKIWVPWTLTVLTPGSAHVRIFYAGQSLQSEDDQYVTAAFPNAYPNGDVCMGLSLNWFIDSIIDSETPLAEVHREVFNEYFSGGWNTDLQASIYTTLVDSLCYNVVMNNPEDFPMLHRFLVPRDGILDQFSHLPKRLRNLISSDSNAVSSNRWKQFTYTLLMLSDFTLSETLEFYREYATVVSSTLSFNEVTTTLNKIQAQISRVTNDHYDGMTSNSIDFALLPRSPVVPELTGLVNQDSDMNLSSDFFIFTFDSESTETLLWNFAYTYATPAEQQLLHDIFIDHIACRQHDNSCFLYCVSIRELRWHRIPITSDSSYYSSTLAAHAALDFYQQLGNNPVDQYTAADLRPAASNHSGQG